MSQKYNDSILKIADYLCSDHKKAEYVVNCFIQQERHDMDEITRAEGVLSLHEKYFARMQAKDHQIHELIPFLNNFKNEKFKYRVAEFIQWCCLQLDPPKLFNQTFSSDLKANLRDLRRYEGEMDMMTEDVNRRFKFLSPTSSLPES